MSVEQDKTITAMKGMLLATSPMDMINAGLQIVNDLFPDESASFADSVCNAWETISSLPTLPPNADLGCILAAKLRQMIPISGGTLQKVLISMMCLAPHSMQTERVVSYYNTFCSDKRFSTDSSTVNHRLQIALNGKGTAHFDPRPSVAKFLEKKERRYREPDITTYQQREFVAKFFRSKPCL